MDYDPDAFFGQLAPFFPLRHRLNKIQKQVAPTLLQQDHSVVIAAPTGGGKTLLLECAIARLFRSRLVENLQNHNNNNNNNRPQQQQQQRSRVRAVYLCPMKALANERFSDWSLRFGHHGVRVAIETGDQSEISSSSSSLRNDNNTNPNHDPVADALPPDDVLDADLIISTPERWDAITRRWTHHTMLDFVASVRLLLIDEVHVLSEPRGAVLEVIVSRMRTIHREVEAQGPRVRAAMQQQQHQQQQQQHQMNNDSSQNDTDDPSLLAASAFSSNHPLHHSSNTPTSTIRFVAASGTVSNPQDIAAWLQCPAHNGCFRFTEADRPVPLAVHVHAVGGGQGGGNTNPFALEKTMTYRLPNVISTYSDGKPTLVFCCSRREVSATAEYLAGEALQPTEAEIQRQLLDAVAQVSDATLKRALPKRVAIHHAALSLPDRRAVERLFLNQTVLVLCTTTTLSVGVNLPARLVIVKGTVSFAGNSNTNNNIPSARNASSGGGAAAAAGGGGGAKAAGGGGGASSHISDLSLSDVAQMCGRAGRAGFDDQGVAVILTPANKVRTYEVLQSGRQPPPVESQLHLNMIAHVNAELVLGTIVSPATAAAWLETTYLWVRLQRNPAHYWTLLTTATKKNQNSNCNSSNKNQNQQLVFAAELARSILAQLIAADCCAAPTLPLVRRCGGQRSFSGRLFGKEAELCRELDQEDGGKNISLVPTVAGRIFARFYLDFDTIICFSQQVGWPAALAAAHEEEEEQHGKQKQNDDDADDDDADATAAHPLDHDTDIFPCSIRSVLVAICHASEFDECCRLRQGDRGPLNELNKGNIRFPLHDGNNKGGREVRETWQKVFVLIQYRLQQQQQQPQQQQQQQQTTTVMPTSLVNDAAKMWHALPRLAHAMTEMAELTQHSQLLVSAWRLRKCIDRGLWWDAPRLTRQLPGVGDAISRALLDKGGYSSIADLLAPEVDPRRLEAMCGRNPPFGSLLLRACHSIPRFKVSISTTALTHGGGEDSSNNSNSRKSGGFKTKQCTVTLTAQPSESLLRGGNGAAAPGGGGGGGDTVSRFLLIVAECRFRCKVLFVKRLRFRGNSWWQKATTEDDDDDDETRLTPHKPAVAEQCFTFDLPDSSAALASDSIHRARLVQRRKELLEQQLLKITNKRTRLSFQKQHQQQLANQGGPQQLSSEAPFLRAWLLHESFIGCDAGAAASPNVLFGSLGSVAGGGGGGGAAADDEILIEDDDDDDNGDDSVEEKKDVAATGADVDASNKDDDKTTAAAIVVATEEEEEKKKKKTPLKAHQEEQQHQLPSPITIDDIHDGDAAIEKSDIVVLDDDVAEKKMKMENTVHQVAPAPAPPAAAATTAASSSSTGHARRVTRFIQQVMAGADSDKNTADKQQQHQHEGISPPDFGDTTSSSMPGAATANTCVVDAAVRSGFTTTNSSVDRGGGGGGDGSRIRPRSPDPIAPKGCGGNNNNNNSNNNLQRQQLATKPTVTEIALNSSTDKADSFLDQYRFDEGQFREHCDKRNAERAQTEERGKSSSMMMAMQQQPRPQQNFFGAVDFNPRIIQQQQQYHHNHLQYNNLPQQNFFAPPFAHHHHHQLPLQFYSSQLYQQQHQHQHPSDFGFPENPAAGRGGYGYPVQPHQHHHQQHHQNSNHFFAQPPSTPAGPPQNNMQQQQQHQQQPSFIFDLPRLQQQQQQPQQMPMQYGFETPSAVPQSQQQQQQQQQQRQCVHQTPMMNNTLQQSQQQPPQQRFHSSSSSSGFSRLSSRLAQNQQQGQGAAVALRQHPGNRSGGTGGHQQNQVAQTPGSSASLRAYNLFR